MRETGPVRKDLDQDADAAAPYIGVARVLLGQLKNQMRLGGMAQLSRTAYLADGTAITVASRFGQDAIRIVTVSAPVTQVSTEASELTPEFPQVETPQVDVPLPVPKYLLAVFKNNHVAAIPMDSLHGAHWSAIYHAQLKEGALSDRAFMAQYNFGVIGCDSVFLAPFSLEDRVLALDPSFKWLNAVRHNDGTDAKCVHAIKTQTKAGADPICNGSGATVYAPDGMYSVSKGVPALQQSHVSDFANSSPRAIGPDGTYYFEAKCNRLAGNFTPAPPPGLDIPPAVILFGSGGLPANTAAIQQQIAGAAAYSVSEVFQGGPSFTCKVAADAAVSPPGTAPDYSMAIPVAIYQRGGGRDQIDMQTIQANAVDTRTDQGLTIAVNASQSLLDWSETMAWTATQHVNGPQNITFTFTLQESGFNLISLNGFPPALGPTQVYGFAQNNAGDVTVTKTPYFTSNDFSSYGWLHLSNGKHVMQGFFTTSNNPIDTPHLYLDGQDVRAKLEAALSTAALPVTLADVQALVMDIPLDLIKLLR